MIKKTLFKRALFLEYFTVGYNLIEAAVSVYFGRAAGSIALIGFGLDSIVESLSGFVLIWRIRQHGRVSEEEEERIERRASQFVGLTFVLLAGYVLFESVRKIILNDISDPSLPGIFIAAISLVIMPVLGMMKLKTGQELGLTSLIADSKETFVCATLSGALLLGLVSRYMFNFWLADPLVGIIIVGYLVKEGIELIRGEDDD